MKSTLSSSRQPGSPKRSRTLDIGLAQIIASLIAGITAISVAFISGRITAPSPTGSFVASKARSLPALGISLTDGQVIPYCIPTLNGTGQIPHGDAVLLLNRRANSDDLPSGSYSLVGQAMPSGNEWSMKSVLIGSQYATKEFDVELTAILVAKPFATFVSQIDGNGGWSTPALPPSLEHVNVFVVRNLNSRNC